MATKYELTNSDAEETLLPKSDDDAPVYLGSSQYDPYQPTFGPQSVSPDTAVTSGTNPQPIINQPYPFYPHSYPTPYAEQPATSTTTVVVQQQSQSRPPRNWSSRLCECGKVWSICCCGLFCECCLASRVSQDLGESAMVPCCVPGWLIVLRTKMRLSENINGSVMDDCCSVCCCTTCSLCQLAYEIKVVRERDQALATQLNVV